MRYVIKNKNYNTYLKYIKRLCLDHYVVNINEASIFTKAEAKRHFNKFKHPENWEILTLKINVSN